MDISGNAYPNGKNIDVVEGANEKLGYQQYNNLAFFINKSTGTVTYA